MYAFSKKTDCCLGSDCLYCFNVGYETFELHNFDTKITKQVTMLIVQDHWLKVNSYVDFEFISCISAINY